MPEVHLRPLKFYLTAPLHRVTRLMHTRRCKRYRLGTILACCVLFLQSTIPASAVPAGALTFSPASRPATIGRGSVGAAANYNADSSNDSLQPVSARVPVRSSGGVDTVVTYKAKDSVVFSLRSKKMRLRGTAETALRARVLQSEVIEIFFDSGLLNSTGAKDSAGTMIGYPVFNDNGSSYAGEVIKYNLRNQLGTVSLGETTIQNGFFTGSRIKRNADQSLYVEHGCFTTCDKPHPHFYLTAEHMKLIPDDRVFMEDFYLVVGDIPILYVPIGVFFPNSRGRQSGIILPRPFVDANRGVSFQNFGYYFALSDYYDTQITADFYSKGGWQLNNRWNYNVRYLLSGQLDASYAYVRPNTRLPYQRDYRFAWNHNQTISPQTQFTANLNFQSNTFNTNTIATLQQRIQKNVFSSAGLSHSFGNNISTSLNYVRNQDIEAKTYEQSPTASLTVPAFFPFKTKGSTSWLSDISINYSTVVAPTFTHGLSVQSRDSVYFDSVANKDRIQTLYDSTYSDTYKAVWRHSPSITISPKLGVVSVTPAVNFSANMYPRRIVERRYDSVTKKTLDIVENGLFTEYNASLGVTTRTTLYGTPLVLGSLALRHTLMPSVGLSYTPDFSAERYGFYSSYNLPADSMNKLARSIQYSRFEQDGGGIASRRKALLMNWALDNSIDAKVFRDSADEKIELARINVSGNVNFLLDSNSVSDIRWSVRTPTVGESSLTADFTTTVYDDVQLRDTSGALTPRYSRVASSLLDAGKFPLRVSGFNLFFSTSFGSARSASVDSRPEADDTTTSSIGDRFKQRVGYVEQDEDVFGDSSPGYRPLLFPWSVSMSLTYSYQKPFSGSAPTQVFNLQSTMNLSLSSTLSLVGGLNVDLLQGTINAPAITIRKIIHCWALDVTWYPTGFVRGFYLSFSPTSSLLRDLRLERRSSSYIR